MQTHIMTGAQMPGTDVAKTSRPLQSLCWHIASHAAVAPDRPAVIDSSARLTYAQLEHQSNQLAARLLEMGAGPECCIGLLLERSPRFVVAALAVLKTGAAYLPMDSATPEDRAASILRDAEAPIVLTQRQKAQALAAGPWRVLDFDGPDAAGILTRAAAPIHIEPAPDSLAYVIYTSGSTGQPKGVEITHTNLSNLIEWHVTAFEVTTSDHASQVTGLGFDAAVWELWPHLAAGSSVHIADEITRRSPLALREWLLAKRITISFVPTVLAEQMLQAAWPEETALRTLLTGADTLNGRPAQGLPFAVVNNYGPTECTVVATSGSVTPQGDDPSRPTIGRPISDTTVLILDDALHPVLPGEPGELCLAGSLVGRGYRKNPELTTSRFVVIKSESGQPVRIYRTGDRARLLDNGEIAFLGRLDEQVKIRGYRVELGEITASLNQHPGIEASAVVVHQANWDRRVTNTESTLSINVRNARSAGGFGPDLVGYVVVAGEDTPTAADLRDFLAARLPDYMLPILFVEVAALPVTANGKLDKSALPLPAADNLISAHAAEATSSQPDSVQQLLSALVASLLRRPYVGADENFFLIGGHSMLGIQLVSRIREQFGVALSLRQLFSAPTVAALSGEVGRLTKTPETEMNTCE
jgi:amino acid adenylation domain-containing protein